MTVWVTIYRSAWTVLIVLCIIGVVCVFLPQYNRLREMHREKDVRQTENREMESQIRRLRSNQKRFKGDPVFVERTAREMGMIKPHEKVLKFTNTQSRTKSPVTP